MTTTPDVRSGLKSSVCVAIDQLEQAYAGHEMRVIPDGQGGAWVELLEISLGGAYAQAETFVVFLLPFNLPASDIYPLFVRPDLTRSDGEPHGAALQVTTLAWPGTPEQRPVIQVSRRTKGSFTAQTAPQKVEKVLAWLRTYEATP